MCSAVQLPTVCCLLALCVHLTEKLSRTQKWPLSVGGVCNTAWAAGRANIYQLPPKHRSFPDDHLMQITLLQDSNEYVSLQWPVRVSEQDSDICTWARGCQVICVFKRWNKLLSASKLNQHGWTVVLHVICLLPVFVCFTMLGPS